MARGVRLSAPHLGAIGHSAQSSSASNELQPAHNAQSSQAFSVARGHAYLRLDDRPTLPAIAPGADPHIENGAVIFDSGKFIAYPTIGDPVGPFARHDEAQAALQVHALVCVLVWLAGLSSRAPSGTLHGLSRGDLRKDAPEEQRDERPSVNGPRGGA